MSEAQYARLLRLYPAGYPRDEMLGVLLAGGRPLRHELLPLVLGGLRARCDGGQPLGMRWLHAARAAALLLLVLTSGNQLPRVIDGWAPPTSMVVTWAAAGFAIVAVILGVRRPAFALALIAFLAATSTGSGWQFAVEYALAAALLLTPGPRTPVAASLPLAVAAFTAPFAPTWLDVALLAVLVLWSVLDERILLAIGISLGAGAIHIIGEISVGLDSQTVPRLLASYALIPAVLVSIGATLALRRARI